MISAQRNFIGAGSAFRQNILVARRESGAYWKRGMLSYGAQADEIQQGASGKICHSRKKPLQDAHFVVVAFQASGWYERIISKIL